MDGFPGSLVGTGLDQRNLVSEISIPAPVISASKNPEELPTAATLQPFADLRGGLFDSLVEVPRAGMCVLSDAQTGETLHLAWGAHFQEDAAQRIPSHAWCNLTLGAPATRGAWWIGEASLASVNGYILQIPDAWASAHVGGRRLGTGRFRDGGWSGMGPALFAYAPWLSGNPPAAGTRLNVVPLLRYSHTRGEDPDPTSFRMNGYQHNDEWSSASAARLVFYDPADLTRVARGEWQPHQPQPYASLDLDTRLFLPDPSVEPDMLGRGAQRRYRLGETAYDRARGHLFILEKFADGPKPVVHVWKVRP